MSILRARMEVGHVLSQGMILGLTLFPPLSQ